MSANSLDFAASEHIKLKDMASMRRGRRVAGHKKDFLLLIVTAAALVLSGNQCNQCQLRLRPQ